jgi:hypothetical protein
MESSVMEWLLRFVPKPAKAMTGGESVHADSRRQGLAEPGKLLISN